MISRIAWHFLIIVIVSLVACDTLAQLSQPLRYEREHKHGDHEFIIVSMNEAGVALVRDTEKFDRTKRTWEVIILDSLLNESWTTTVEVNHNMNILGHDYRDGNVYFIFKEHDAASKPVLLVEILLKERAVKTHLIKAEIQIQYTHFSILNKQAIFGGYVNREPTLLLYNINDEVAKVIPGVFQPNTHLLDVRANSNETFNVVLMQRQANSTRAIVVRTYDPNGAMLVEDVINIESGKSVLDAITSALVHDEMLITGTWAYGYNSKTASGIFSVLVDPFHDQKVNFYDFTELEHFLDYLKPKRVAKIKAKAKWRRSVGKPVEFRTYFNPIRVAENKDGFMFLGEVYDPPSYSTPRYGSPYNYYPNYNNSGPYGPYGYSPYSFNSMPYRYYSPYGTSPYGYGPIPTDTRIIHSSVISFDNHGELVTDQSLKFPTIRLNSKDQVSDFVKVHDRTVILCKDEKDIYSKIVATDSVREEKFPPKLNSNEIVRSETQENSSVRFWYGQFFFVYGYQTLRGNVEKPARDVFYINKIKVE